jgi:hypothetical protein
LVEDVAVAVHQIARRVTPHNKVGVADPMKGLDQGVDAVVVPRGPEEAEVKPTGARVNLGGWEMGNPFGT